jgi:hypothetical protein
MYILNTLSSKQPKFTHLLIDLILIFILSPLANNYIGYLILSGGFFFINLLVIKALSLSKFWLNLLRIIALTSFVLDMIARNTLIANVDSIYFISNIIDSSFILLAILLIGNQIFKQNEVDIHIVNGGICLFLLIGFLWFNLYQIIFLVDQNAFQGLSKVSKADIYYQLLYYSFTTLTTLGYGDISPVHKFAMMLANLEAIIGLMYPAIFIARLVSLYSSPENGIDN